MGWSGRRGDVVLSVVVGVFVAIATAVHAGGVHTADLKAYPLIALGAATIAVRRRFPLVAVTVAGVSTALYYIGPFPDGPEMLTFGVVAFMAAANKQRFAACFGSGVTLAVFAWSEFVIGPARVGRFLGVLAWMLVVLCAGEVSRYHRAYVREAKRRKDEVERMREEELRRRATEERLRIARELHDVLAHKISLINVQAGAALHRRDPEQAYTALDAIKDASRETLRELRSTLGVLRQVDEAGPLSPAPSLDRIDELISQTNDTGLSVRLTVSGDRTALPAPVDLAAYRIVQEALTNAVRHAGSATATVLVRYNADSVVVEVGDDGRGADAHATGADAHATGADSHPADADAPTGNGISGMRERAATLGGTLTAGTRPGGGFLVRASLPLRPAMSS